MKKINKPISGCSCCQLFYSKSSVFGGLTINLIKNDDPDVASIIDIPRSELENLRNVIDNLLESK